MCVDSSTCSDHLSRCVQSPEVTLYRLTMPQQSLRRRPTTLEYSHDSFWCESFNGSGHGEERDRHICVPSFNELECAHDDAAP